MAAIRYRWLLPAAHAAVDVALVLMLVHRTTVEIERERPTRFVQESPSQEEHEIRWDPPWLPPPPEVLAIIGGTPPAGIVAGILTPNADFFALRRGLDWRWFALHTGVAMATWFAIGLWLDCSRLRGSRILALSYLGLRTCSVPLTLIGVGGAYKLLVLGWLPCVLYPLCGAAYWFARGAVRAVRRARGC
jgi:hypothetical protein